MGVWEILKKRIRDAQMKRLIHWHEARFTMNGHTLRYLLLKPRGGQARRLIVSFSGFAAESNRPRYNYIRTLSRFKDLKLFLLDDFGFEQRGSYYLGEGGHFFLREMIPQLVEKIAAEAGVRERVFLGSSKGGTAALLHGLASGADRVIMGAPQYYIGQYLNGTPEHRKILSTVAGSASEAAIRQLDQLLPGLVAGAAGGNKPRVYLHYSKSEHTYREHIAGLILDLRAAGFRVEEDVQAYLNHKDVAAHFPKYLIRVLKDSDGSKEDK